MSPVETTMPAAVGSRRLTFPPRKVLVGGIVVGLACAVALFAPLLAPHDPYIQRLDARLRPAVWAEGGSWEYILGTDQLGRDYLSRIIYGSRISLMIGFLTAAISGFIGITLGTLAGYFRGRVDLIISFLITVRLTLPAVLVALAVVGMVGSSLQVVVLVLGCLLWDRFAVVSRGATMQVRAQDYIAASRVLGCSHFRIILRDILPNILPSLIVVATIETGYAILLEAALSFLGLGVQPPTPSWGLMIAESRGQVFFSPGLILYPGIVLLVLVLGINLLGDGLRSRKP